MEIIGSAGDDMAGLGHERIKGKTRRSIGSSPTFYLKKAAMGTRTWTTEIFNGSHPCRPWKQTYITSYHSYRTPLVNGQLPTSSSDDLYNRLSSTCNMSYGDKPSVAIGV